MLNMSSGAFLDWANHWPKCSLPLGSSTDIRDAIAINFQGTPAGAKPLAIEESPLLDAIVPPTYKPIYDGR